MESACHPHDKVKVTKSLSYRRDNGLPVLSARSVIIRVVGIVVLAVPVSISVPVALPAAGDGVDGGADEGKRSRATRLPQFAIGESCVLYSTCFLLCSLDFRFAHPAAGGAHLRPEQDKAQGQKNRGNDAFTFGISITPGRSSARTYWAWCLALRSLRREGRLALHDGGHAQEETD